MIILYNRWNYQMFLTWLDVLQSLPLLSGLFQLCIFFCRERKGEVRKLIQLIYMVILKPHKLQASNSVLSAKGLWCNCWHPPSLCPVINASYLTDLHHPEHHWDPTLPPRRQPALLREVLPAIAAWYLGYTHKFLWEEDARQRRGCVRVCVCHLQALAGLLRLPVSAEDHSASVLKSAQLPNKGLSYTQRGPDDGC